MMKYSSNNRHILVVTGNGSECLSYAKHITQNIDSLVLEDTKKAQDFLGQEFDAVIYDMHSKFDANAFGAITGTIRGGGYLILLRPKLHLDTGESNSLFLQRFNQLLENHSNTHFIQADPTLPDTNLLAKPQTSKFSDIFATSDQKEAVAAIIKVVTGHRRRPLVITSDRGRGKSAALGIAVAKLATQNIKTIIICAPSKKAAAMVFKHAKLSIESETKLIFYSPDDLQQQKPKADLVLIDEAAAIPISLLTQFLQQYSRIVFASTQHGYEGCGRGFAINFSKILNKETPNWKRSKLKTPIRWRSKDSLEQFTFDALLLNSEKAEGSLVSNTKITDCSFKQIEKTELLTNNEKLKQLFGLLVSAHYQTKPSDLMQLLDDNNVVVYSLETTTAVVAVALVITEGNINSDSSDKQLSADIFSGKRRLQGHLVAQLLSSNLGIESAIQLSGERVSRIAVHPHLHNKGFGSHLLRKIITQSRADYLSTSYGATLPLISFWQSLGFTAVNLGIKRDASTGAHSVTMLYPKTNSGITLLEQARHIFTRSFPQLLSDPLSRLESDIAFALLPKQSKNCNVDGDIRPLNAFAYGQRSYENSLYLIWELVCSTLSKNESLTEIEQEVLIRKVLQKQTWAAITNDMSKISGKKQALSIIRAAITKLL